MATEPAPRDDAPRRAVRDDALHPRLVVVDTLAGATERRGAAVRAMIGQAIELLARTLRDGIVARLHRTRADDTAELVATAVFDHEAAVSVAMADPATARQLAIRAELDRLASALPIADADAAPGLLARLAEHADAAVAGAARALLVADNGRRADPLAALSTKRLKRVAWTVAARLRTGDVVAYDRAAIAEVRPLVGAHEDPGAAAIRLARLVDEGSDAVLLDALADRRLDLCVALLANRYDVGFADVGNLLLAPDDDRLWWLCRALKLPRRTMARIGVALSQADPGRDLERFADRLDAVMAVSPAQAHARVAALQLPPGYRAALGAEEGAE